MNKAQKWLLSFGRLCVLIWSVTWKFNDQVLEDTELYHFEKYEDTHCLEVKDVEKQDAGPYTCIAVNTEGDATCQIPLVVNGKISCTDQFLCRIASCHFCLWLTVL